MKTIPLINSDLVAIVDDADHHWLSQASWRLDKDGYARMCRELHAKGETLMLMHRLILLAPRGALPDHINGKRLDNRRKNLRLATWSEQLQNRRGATKSRYTKYHGVSFHKRHGGFTAQIQKDRKSYYLGYFKTDVEAARAYNAKALELYGQHARLNQIDNAAARRCES